MRRYIYEKNFIEVLKDIKEGEIWECTDSVYKIRYIEHCGLYGIRIHQRELSRDTYIDIEECKFKLRMKEFTFDEAFEKFEMGKEIKSTFSGNRYVILNGVEFIERPYESGRSQAFECIKFSTNEIKGGWYIYMIKIIALLGLSCAGKDTIIEKLSYETKIPTIISHTTRPMRENELNGLQYHFSSDDFFEENKDRFIEQRIYKVKNKDNSTSVWRYGIHEDSVKEGANLVIVDPPGLKDLIKYYGKENIIPFYIFARDETRMERLKKRGDFNNPMEVKRRFKDDNERFKEFIQSKDYYKICNDSNDVNLAVQEIKAILNKIVD